MPFGNRLGVHFGATWRIRLNGPCAAVMRSRVKLLCVFGIIIINRFCYVFNSCSFALVGD